MTSIREIMTIEEIANVIKKAIEIRDNSSAPVPNGVDGHYHITVQDAMTEACLFYKIDTRIAFILAGAARGLGYELYKWADEIL